MSAFFDPGRHVQAALRVLLPLRCLVCGDPGHDGLDLCDACLARLPWAGRACLRCALPLPDTALIVCGTCREEVPPQAATHASLLYLPVRRQNDWQGKNRNVWRSVRNRCLLA